MTGTHVIANQGGCTVWCDDCHESHNCEEWSQERTLKWMREHPGNCVVLIRRRLAEAEKKSKALPALKRKLARLEARDARRKARST